MISSQDKGIKSLIATLARTLSPTGKYRRNDIGKEWIFEKSNWVAKEIYGNTDLKELIGIKLSSPEFDSRTITFIEHALALLMGERALVDDCVLIDEQHWSDIHFPNGYDCGYETTYRLKNDTLRITIRHRASKRRRNSTAVAVLRRQGTDPSPKNWTLGVLGFLLPEWLFNRRRKHEKELYQRAGHLHLASS